MQVRARVTFQSRYGFIRTGEVFTAEEGYGQQLIIGGKVEREGRPEMKPERRQAAQADAKDEGDSAPPASEKAKDAGPEKRSLLSRAVRRRPVKTPSIALIAL